jgi:hypothetical protein
MRFNNGVLRSFTAVGGDNKGFVISVSYGLVSLFVSSGYFSIYLLCSAHIMALGLH